jgi:hypothetical protein
MLIKACGVLGSEYIESDSVTDIYVYAVSQWRHNCPLKMTNWHQLRRRRRYVWDVMQLRYRILGRAEWLGFDFRPGLDFSFLHHIHTGTVNRPAGSPSSE